LLRGTIEDSIDCDKNATSFGHISSNLETYNALHFVKCGFVTHFDAKVLRSGFPILPTMEVLFG